MSAFTIHIRRTEMSVIGRSSWVGAGVFQGIPQIFLLDF
jgi:hypothetical protein